MLEGRKVVLRPFVRSDITDDYLRWLNDVNVLRYSNQRFRQHSRKTCHAYLDSFEDSANMFLAITTGRNLIGTMTAYISTVHKRADMGIMIGDPRSWGKGIGSDAWETLMDHLLTRGDLRKVAGGTLRRNVGMVRIMQKLGMTPDGVRVAHELVDGVPQDVLHFAKFSDE